MVLILIGTVVALLLCLPFTNLGSALEVGQDVKLRADLQALSQALDAYRELNGFLPTTEQGLDALVTKPATAPRPEHWYQIMKQLPKDPFRNDYVYACPGVHNPKSFDLYSKGKDRIADTLDDKGNWNFR